MTKNIIQLSQRRKYTRYVNWRKRARVEDVSVEVERALVSHQTGDVLTALSGYCLGVFTVIYGNRSMMRHRSDILFGRQIPENYSWSYLDVFPEASIQVLASVLGGLG